MLGRVAGSSSLKTTAQAESACGTKLAPVRVEALGDRGPRGSAHRAASVVPSNPSDLRTCQRQISPPLTTQRTRNQADHMPWLPKNLKHRSELQQPPKNLEPSPPSHRASRPPSPVVIVLTTHTRNRGQGQHAARWLQLAMVRVTQSDLESWIGSSAICKVTRPPPANEHVSQTQQQWMSLWFL